MVRKKRCIAAGKYYLLGLVTAVAVMSAMWFQSFVSLADSSGTVIADSAKIREKADTSSEVIGSAARGKTVSIKSEVQDASGMVWYEVYVDANTTGYIRSDLVEKKDGGDGGQTASQGNTQPGASGAAEDPGTFIDAQYATVTPETIKVRTAPSTSEAVVDRLTKDAQVIVSGQSDGIDGKLWYYVTFTGTGGVERTGYIRSDLLSLGEMVPVPEEEMTEPEPQVTEPEPVTPVNNDYELTHEPGPDGSDVWYIYDYTNADGSNTSRKYPLEQLMAVTKARSENDTANAKTLVRQRVVIIVLIVLLVISIALMVIMALKLRDVYYEEYEDEDEGEREETSPQRRQRTEESAEAAVRRRRSTEEAGESPSQRRRRAEEADETSVRRRRHMENTEDDTDRPVRRRQERNERRSVMGEVEYHDDEAGQAAVNTAPKRKTKNFLLDDDEFEFEFLNMDDKDL